MAKVIIDLEACVGCGVCVALCGEVFEYGTEGEEKIKITEKYRDENPKTGEVPDDIGCLKRAFGACQVDAISVD